MLLFDEEIISSGKAIEYLQQADQLGSFLQVLQIQHLISKELEAHPELVPDPKIIDALVGEFMHKCNSQELDMFNAWSDENDLDLVMFRELLSRQEAEQQLVRYISEPNLDRHFMDRKHQLDQFYLSAIVVCNEGLARELYKEITEEGAFFQQLAQEHSIDTHGWDSELLTVVRREAIPDEFKSALETAKPGGLVGPLAVRGRWWLLEIDHIRPAALEGEVEEQLRIELFQKWLTDRLTTMTVHMEVTEWVSL